GDGYTADLILRDHDGGDTHLPSKVPYRAARAGETFIAVGACGGGYGAPEERDPQRVLDDVLDGYITREAAEADYGVVIGEDMALDINSTTELRAHRANGNAI
ncbi:MAG: hydantoinase B/oxoprolinase family protein, partial [Pseudomonadota bacterium]